MVSAHGFEVTLDSNRSIRTDRFERTWVDDKKTRSARDMFPSPYELFLTGMSFMASRRCSRRLAIWTEN
jgi:hypothetical protein